ncbi:MAG: lysophospholipid acyltransferase family protein [Bdellovibrionales bacterium]
MKIDAGKLRLAGRLAVFIVLIIIALPVHLISLRCKEDTRTAIVRGLFKVLCFCLGFKVKTIGQPSNASPCIYVCNHLSYLDIPIVGSTLKASFVSRGDVAGWPVFGYFGKLQRTIFISRKPEKAREAAVAIRERIEAGDRMLFFPEGTSGDGQRLLPIKSSLFDVARPIVRADGTEQQVIVQPISLIVTEMGNLPIGRHNRPLYSWYGDMEFVPHFMQALQMSSFTLEVQYHDPVTMAQFGSRKELAAHCERVMAEGLSRGLAGRPAEVSTLIPAQAH